MAAGLGIEPRLPESKSRVLTITLSDNNKDYGTSAKWL